MRTLSDFLDFGEKMTRPDFWMASHSGVLDDSFGKVFFCFSSKPFPNSFSLPFYHILPFSFSFFLPFSPSFFFFQAHYLHPSGGVTMFYIPASPPSFQSPSPSFLAFSYQVPPPLLSFFFSLSNPLLPLSLFTPSFTSSPSFPSLFFLSLFHPLLPPGLSLETFCQIFCGGRGGRGRER